MYVTSSVEKNGACISGWDCSVISDTDIGSMEITDIRQQTIYGCTRSNTMYSNVGNYMTGGELFYINGRLTHPAVGCNEPLPGTIPLVSDRILGRI